VTDRRDVPEDYTQFFAEYFDFVRGMVRKHGIRDDEAATSHIMLRFYETGVLEQYDPELEFERGGVKRTAKFSTFIGAKVLRYLRNFRERQWINDTREPLRCDQPVGESGALWVEVYAPLYDQVEFLNIEEAQLVLRIRARLDQIEFRGKRKEIPDFFDAVVAQVREHGAIDRSALARKHGISDTAVASWLEVVRAVVSSVAPNAPVFGQ
jgi:hypothetical protein